MSKLSQKLIQNLKPVFAAGLVTFCSVLVQAQEARFLRAQGIFLNAPAPKTFEPSEKAWKLVDAAPLDLEVADRIGFPTQSRRYPRPWKGREVFPKELCLTSPSMKWSNEGFEFRCRLTESVLTESMLRSGHQVPTAVVISTTCEVFEEASQTVVGYLGYFSH